MSAQEPGKVRKAAKRPFTAESAAAEIVAKLTVAAGKGKRSLYTSNTAPEKRALYMEACHALEHQGAIRLRKDPEKWFLAGFAPLEPTVQSVAAKLLAQSAGLPVDLFDLRAVTKKLTSREKQFAVSALEELVRQGTVLELVLKSGPTGRRLYANSATLQARLDPKEARQSIEGEADASHSSADESTIRQAYDRVVRETHFPDVQIGVLHEACGIRLEALKAWILAERSEGRAALSFGDWSLASEARRAAAIEISGERYLLVRLET